MKIALSENIKESKIILVHKLFKVYGNKTIISKQLDISVKTVRAWLKKPIPTPTHELLIDVTGMTLASVKETIFRIVIGYDEKRPISSKRLGMSKRNVRLWIKEHSLPCKRINNDNINKQIIIEQFSDGYLLSDIMRLNNISYKTMLGILFESFGYRGYDDQIIENQYSRQITIDRLT